MTHNEALQIRAVRESARPVSEARQDYASLIQAIGNCHFALLGEASHGTHDFYHRRAQITQWLIEEKDFTTIAVEADWPDAYRVNRFVQGRSDDADPVAALDSFKRFPAWMWRNTDVVEFISWLRDYNDTLPKGARKVGFYGLDLYSLHASARAVLEFLDKVDPEAARRARYRYACFEHFREDTDAYGYAASFGLSKECEDEVVSQLVEMQKRTADLGKRAGTLDLEAFFAAEQNARLVANAERYYRAMFKSHAGSWNLRDRHMADTLEEIVGHLGGASAKVVVWGHNSHLGDARATQMSASENLTSASWFVSGTAMTRSWSALPPIRGQSQPPPNGMIPRKESEFALHSLEVMKHCSMKRSSPGYLLTLRSSKWLAGVLSQEMPKEPLA